MQVMSIGTAKQMCRELGTALRTISEVSVNAPKRIKSKNGVPGFKFVTTDKTTGMKTVEKIKPDGSSQIAKYVPGGPQVKVTKYDTKGELADEFVIDHASNVKLPTLSVIDVQG